jgi:hypothetical protein
VIFQGRSRGFTGGAEDQREDQEERMLGRIKGPVDQTAQTLPQHGDVEIYEQTERQSDEFQIGDDLGFVDR